MISGLQVDLGFCYYDLLLIGRAWNWDFVMFVPFNLLVAYGFRVYLLFPLLLLQFNFWVLGCVWIWVFVILVLL